MTPATGDVLAGKYRVERVLGEGGMGVVLAATHLQFETLVAVKLLHPEVAKASPEILQRFQTEARAVVRLKSEHVARVMDVGELSTGEPFLVMEYLEGSDLAGVIAARGALPVHEAINLALQACDGVAAAHAQGIVHRDLKPANLFVATGSDGLPCVKVLDFGIAKASAGTSGFNMTSTATVMGTPLYMSPEQMRSSRDADARSDVWSLGIILFQMLAGEVPFLGESMPELVLSVLQKPTPVIGRPDVSPALMQVIDACLAKDPADRIQTVGALARALAPFGDEDAPKTALRISRVLGEGNAPAVSLPQRKTPAADAGVATLVAPVRPGAGVSPGNAAGGLPGAPVRAVPLGGSTDLAMGALAPTRLSQAGAAPNRLALFVAAGVLAILSVFGVGYMITRGDRNAANAMPTAASNTSGVASPASTPNGVSTNANGAMNAALDSAVASVTNGSIPSVSPAGSTSATAGAAMSAPVAGATSKPVQATATSTPVSAKTSKGGTAPPSNTGFGDRQ